MMMWQVTWQVTWRVIWRVIWRVTKLITVHPGPRILTTCRHRTTCETSQPTC
jgi:hypothetical protein